MEKAGTAGVGGFVPTPWPSLPLPSPEQVAFARSSPKAFEEMIDWLQKRERLIVLEQEDPLRYGHEPYTWAKSRELLKVCDDLLIQGGNRAGKTELAAKLVVEALVSRENARVWCLHSSDKTSVAMQQPVVHKYLPPEWRNMGKKGRVANVCYTQKNGFSEGSFVLPNGSQCWFMNYCQDPKVIEGGELDLIWCDELVPYDWVETLRYRLVTRRGKLVITFTPVNGFSLVVKDYVSGARVAESLPSPLLPDRVNVQGCRRGHMPFVLEPPRKSQRVIYFHTSANPYNPYDQLVEALKGRPSPEVKIRAYGWADKLTGNVFPKFGEVNIVGPEEVPKEGSNWCVCDPGGAKNWFFVWIRCDALGRRFVYREWPPVQTHGEWALPSEKADGKPGPAQKTDAGRGITGYKQLLAELEKGEVIEGRLIDPRAGNAAVPGIDEGTSIVEMMLEEQRDSEGKVSGEPMYFEPAPACKVDEGSTLINDWLDYAVEEKVTALNCPRLYVSRECQNVIYALREWTGADGEKGACKDPIDCLKMAAKRPVEWRDEKAAVCWGGGRGY
jgi:hypothetical protein